MRSLVAPGGTLLAIQFRYDGSGPLDAGPPFPQPRELFDRLAGDVLDVAALEELEANGPRWRAELRRVSRRRGGGGERMPDGHPHHR